MCATICPGNCVLGLQRLVVKSEASPQLWKVTCLELEGAHFLLRAHQEGQGGRRLAKGASVKSWVSYLGSPRSPLQPQMRAPYAQAPSFACSYTSGRTVASRGSCWLCALGFLQVKNLRLREVQLTTQGHTAIEMVREPGQSHSGAMSLASRP